MPKNNKIPNFDIGEAPTVRENLDDNINDDDDDDVIKDKSGNIFDPKIHKDPQAFTPKGKFKKLSKKRNSKNPDVVGENVGELVIQFLDASLNSYIKDTKQDDVENEKTGLKRYEIIDNVLIEKINNYFDEPDKFVKALDKIPDLFFITAIVGFYGIQAMSKNKVKTRKYMTKFFNVKEKTKIGFFAIKQKFRRGKK